MKAFWDDLFSDMEDRGIDKETFAMIAGANIKDNLRSIEDAIRKYDGKKALDLIDELKSIY